MAVLLCPASWVHAGASVDPTRDYLLWYRNYDSPAIHALVKLALRKTPEYGSYRLVRSQELSQGRVLRELSRNQSRLVDIANVATSQEREAFLTAVPIPIDGGLLGFRVCVVRPENLPLFTNIRTLEDLEGSNIRIGQGTHWPDTEVLRANNIKVVTHTRYEILFSMLRNDRFECFARGASEVLYDLEVEADPNLVIEPDILLAYAMPSYLFVAQEDRQTAHRLQLGMERAILDGSFGEFLKTYYGRAVKELNLPRRRVLVLENPYLSEDSGNVGRRTLETLRRRLDLLSR
ncbi:transporter substrate-binding domain-containing protein [Marinobacter sp. F4206]|nr:transporter substrate-binding domain-containing protein [Marinobacter sp. F4206]